MKCVFLPPAQAELEEAVEFYNAQQNGLGEDFENEVKATLTRILSHPRA